MPSKRTIAAVFVLSLAVWLFFYVATPRAPLTPAETAIVVAVCGALVLGVQHIIARIRKKPEAHDATLPDSKPSAAGVDPRKG